MANEIFKTKEKIQRSDALLVVKNSIWLKVATFIILFLFIVILYLIFLEKGAQDFWFITALVIMPLGLIIVSYDLFLDLFGYSKIIIAVAEGVFIRTPLSKYCIFLPWEKIESIESYSSSPQRGKSKLWGYRRIIFHAQSDSSQLFKKNYSTLLLLRNAKKESQVVIEKLNKVKTEYLSLQKDSKIIY